MAITIPPIFTGIHDGEVTHKFSVHEETVRKMIQNMNMVGELAKIGSIRAIQLNQTGTPVPEETIWQLCDQSEITYPNSPLRSMGLIQRFTPLMVSTYPRGAVTTTANNVGGSPTVSLSHSHGGQTGSLGGSVVGEEGDEKTARVEHSHPINPDLSNSEPLEMAHQQVAFYLKIT